MIPWQKAKLWLSCFPEAESIESLIADYLNCGVVYSSDRGFMLVRRCKWNGQFPDFYADKKDAWFVQIASGDLAYLFDRLPQQLDWVVFQRHGMQRFKAYNSSNLHKKLKVKQNSTI